MNPTIDDYLNEVAQHLRLRGAPRKQALNDLRELLTDSDDPASIAGDPAAYAASLDEQFGTVPFSPITGIGRRLAGTFDPANPKVMVPKVFGAGWTFNMGAVAVRLGLLRPDDVDDEVLDEATDHLLISQAVAAATIVGSVAAAAATWRSRHAIERVLGKSMTPNLAFAVVSPVFTSGLLVASTSLGIAPSQRLTLPSQAAALSLMSIGAGAQLLTNPKGSRHAIAGVVAGLAGELLLSYLPVRAALRDGWERLR